MATDRSVSIIIPFQNGEAFLAGCCASVQNQTFPHWEAVLVDDGSIDSSAQIARRFVEGDDRFKLISSQRTDQITKGPWWPRNVGLQQARFNLVSFLDADDLWHPRKLELQMQAMQLHGADLCTTSYVRFQGTRGLIIEKRVPPVRPQSPRFRFVNTIPLSSVLIRRHLLGEGFRAVVHEDHDLWIRLMAAMKVSTYNVAQPLMAYRIHPANLTGGTFRKLGMKRRQYLNWNIGFSGMVAIANAQLRYLCNSLYWRLSRRSIASMGFSLDPEIR